jgi:hypothetical protein
MLLQFSVFSLLLTMLCAQALSQDNSRAMPKSPILTYRIV